MQIFNLVVDENIIPFFLHFDIRGKMKSIRTIKSNIICTSLITFACVTSFGGIGSTFHPSTLVVVAMKGTTQPLSKTTTTASSPKNNRRLATATSPENNRRLGGGKGQYRYNSGSSGGYHSGGSSSGYSSYQNQAYSSYYNGGGYYRNGGSNTNPYGTNNRNNHYTGSYSQNNTSRSIGWWGITLLVIIALIGIALVYLSMPEILACSSANKKRKRTDGTTNDGAHDYHNLKEDIGKGKVKVVVHSSSPSLLMKS